MPEAKNGDKVKVHYTGKLDDGTVSDSSEGREPLEFQVGSGSVIAGFDSAVSGMQEGETRSTHIPADQAYGPYHDEMVMVVPRDQLPPDLEPEVGQVLQVSTQNGEDFMVRITDVTGDQVTLDANHPLAGQDLNFDIQLVQIGQVE